MHAHLARGLVGRRGSRLGVVSHESHNVVVVPYRDQNYITLSEEKKDSHLQAHPEFEVLANFAHTQTLVYMRFPKGLRQQGGGRSDFGL